MKNLTKKQREQIIESYNNSNNRRLEDCYDRYSSAKARAYQYCWNLMAEKGGCGLRILGHNSMSFSVGFRFEENKKEMFAYITKDNIRFFPFELI